MTASDVEESLKVYVSDGEGELGVGDGTVSSPYQNIRTALKQDSVRADTGAFGNGKIYPL